MNPTPEKSKRMNIDLRDRERLIEFVFNHGFSVPQAAIQLKMKLRTAYGILKRFEVENRLETKKQTGRKSIFNETFERNVVDFFLKQPDATLAQWQQSIASNPRLYGPIAPSLTTLFRILKKNRMSLKVVSKVPKVRNSPRVIEARYAYVTNLLNIETSNELQTLIYIDEFGCNLHTRRRYGRSFIGKPATVQVPTRRGDNLSVCAAICSSGPIHTRAKFLAYNTHEFLIFLNELYAKLDPNKRYVVVMDNVRFHHALPIKGWFLDRPNIEPLYLPPYSPFLNPIEECFSKVHQAICMIRPTLERSLLSAVDTAFSSVTAENCEGWIRHARAYNMQCLRREPILKEASENCPRFIVEEGFEDDEEGDEILMV